MDSTTPERMAASFSGEMSSSEVSYHMEYSRWSSSRREKASSSRLVLAVQAPFHSPVNSEEAAEADGRRRTERRGDSRDMERGAEGQNGVCRRDFLSVRRFRENSGHVSGESKGPRGRGDSHGDSGVTLVKGAAAALESWPDRREFPRDSMGKMLRDGDD